MKIVLPKRAIVVMCGAAGSGKTTFARRHFLPSQILSSDFCRQLVCDRVDWSPHVSPAAFRVLHTILEERMRHGLLTVIDSTAVLPVHRSIYVKLARRFRAPIVLVVMNISNKTCIERDRKRPQRVGESAIITQWELLQNGLETVEQEGFTSVYMLDDRTQFNTEVIVGSGANGNHFGNGRAALAQPLTPNDAVAAAVNGNGHHGLNGRGFDQKPSNEPIKFNTAKRPAAKKSAGRKKNTTLLTKRSIPKK